MLLKLIKYLIITLFAFILVLGTTSCSSYKIADNPGWFSINYPNGFEYIVNPDGLGSTPEIDFTKRVPVPTTDADGQPIPPLFYTSGEQVTEIITTTIYVFGVNRSYSDIVEADNTVTWRSGKLVRKDKTMAIFIWPYEEKYKDHKDWIPISQDVYIDRDVGNGRTVVIWGVVKNASKEALDILTRYCIDMANSVKASPDWVVPN